MALNDILILSDEKIMDLKDNDEKSFGTDEIEEYQENQYLLLQNPNEKDIGEIQVIGYDKDKRKGVFKVIRIYDAEDRKVLKYFKRFDARLYCSWD